MGSRLIEVVPEDSLNVLASPVLTTDSGNLGGSDAALGIDADANGREAPSAEEGDSLPLHLFWIALDVLDLLLHLEARLEFVFDGRIALRHKGGFAHYG